MLRGALFAAAALAALAGCGAPARPTGPDGPAAADGSWALVWSDEFEGPAGALVDASRWVHDIGGHGWGNGELQSYTDRGRNASLGGDGTLQIRAFAEDYTGPDGVRRLYTSARLKTLGRFEQAYGRFEARIRVPQGQGLWPAFWMLGADFDQVGWPRCGEIDVMENLGGEPAVVHGSLHGPATTRGFRSMTGTYTLPRGIFAGGFHIFAIEWDPGRVRFFVDGNFYQTRTPEDLEPGGVWVFDKPFFMLLNVAVGGEWPGPPDMTTSFPQQMSVDYVRVYRRRVG